MKKKKFVYYNNPSDDRLFHPWNCLFNGNKLGRHFKYLNQIFDVQESEINSALIELKNYLNLTDEELDKKFTDNNEKLLALIKYYMSINYHFRTDKVLDEESLKKLR